ncbi:TauD/TfdA family dioxygenase [Dapis sp. BLCC M229]|uniref:TauD/TfdA family dioxygenase n=1 Tax=Dapis sp. BLCC M229 TaxID=3400188 RepID=UPI003CED6680
MQTIEKFPNSLPSNIRLRFLRDEEKSFTTCEKELPLIIEPVKEKSFTALAELVRENSDWFNRQQDIYGAILFRGFEVETAVQFESILKLLKVKLESNYYFGSAQRERITDKVFTSSEAPANMIIPPHNELNMVPLRPNFLAFFCQIEPALYGETPIINTEKIFNELSPKLQYKFANSPQKYVRFVPNHLLGIVFEKLSREEITKMLQEEEFCFHWKADGSLYFECSYIPLFYHPITGKLCFGLTTCDCFVTRKWYRNIGQRYPFIQELYYNSLPSKLYKTLEERRGSTATVLENLQQQSSTLSMCLVNEEGNCTKMTEGEATELAKAEWKNAAVFPWRQGDILVIDNLQVAHGRLNTQLPRKILTAFGNMCDIRNMK